uniref:DnaJ homolog subfamily C member 2 n=1 Tax=Globodera pallida TaxID=36090 RepID=A0A183BPC9_GLOPA
MALALYGFLAPKRRIEAAGISYEFSMVKDRLTLGLSTLPVLRIAVQNGTASTEIDGVGELQETVDWLDREDSKFRKYIARLDPNDWKKQDHYKVLGLSKLRYQATPAQLKTAYRRKVLKYHPDKGQAADADDTSLRNEAVFACIQKAYEQLGLSEDRQRAFDSVDPQFDDSVPDSVEASNFFASLGPVFERNARFSVNQPVPLLGDEHSERSHVEHFYEFWFDWRSWREFSYLDSEDKAKGEDRWERREIEKLNKVEREKRRKRDLKRISALVELAYAKDPRVARFKEEDKQTKQAQKERRRREREAREQAEADERRCAEAEAARESEARAEEQRRTAQAKQQQKKAMACQRRRLRDMASTANYWTEDGTLDPRISTIAEQIERVCLSAELDELSALCEGLATVQAFDGAHQLLRECANRNNLVEGKPSETPAGTSNKASNSKIWSPTELQLLIKAVNLFPPGSQERWKQVAEYVSSHGNEQRTERDTINQVKLLKSNPSSNLAPAVRIKSAEANAKAAATPSDEEEWSAEQQKQLECALKATVSVDAKERWDKIAALVDGKDKRECIRRYKAVAEMVKKAKTTAQQK